MYLPSNVSPDLFPQNTSTDYRTHFDKAIHLDGQWEVGVESISYSSHISDEKEVARLNLTVKSKQVATVNSLYDFEFITSNQGTWKGFNGIIPNEFEAKPSEIQSILNTLNAMNRQMLNSQKLTTNGPIFEFYLNKDKYVAYRGIEMGFALQLSIYLAQILGFAYRSVLNGKKTITAVRKPKKGNRDLTKEDYLLRYMSEANQTMKKRITLKASGEISDGKVETFLALWKKHVTPVTDTRPELKKRKLILHNYRKDVGLTFSEDFAQTFGMLTPFFCKGTQWATYSMLLKPGHKTEEWYIDVYDTTLSMTHFYEYQDLALYLNPWQHKSLETVLDELNSRTKNLLQHDLKGVYNEKKHHFQLSLEQNDHVKLIMGSSIGLCYFSPNLAFLLGFPSEAIESREMLGMREVDSLKSSSRQLHLISNVIRPTSYGKHQRQILCDFLHEGNGLPIVEKRFNPISYHPVAQNDIYMIHLKLTDDNYNPIFMPDFTSIVTLYFRRAK